MQCMGDTKAGTWIAKDRYGNKYFENLAEELPLRTRRVDYKDNLIHYNLSLVCTDFIHVDKPPADDSVLETKV
jgi:NADH ubiquinone oxidoreductase subunit NDUFA12